MADRKKYDLSTDKRPTENVMHSTDPENDAIRPYRAPEPVDRPGPSKGDEDDAAPSIVRERLTTFFGRELREPWSFPFLVSIFFLLGMGGVMLGVAVESLEAGLAVCLGTFPFALVLWLTKPPPLVLQFSADGIPFTASNYFLPYHKIQKVFAPQRKTSARFAILLLCDGGHLMLPPKLQGDSEDLYQFLRSQPLGRPAIPPDVDPSFDQFLRQQLTVHEADNVTIYHRPDWTDWQTIYTTYRHNNWNRTALAFLVIGVAWFTAFALLAQREIAAILALLGLIAMGLTGLVFLFGLVATYQRKGPKKLRDAMLIVSPSGLALSQGELKGEMRWREIQNLKMQKTGTVGGSGLLIQVAGASILIADIYQWPAQHIEWLIRKHSGL